MYKKEKKKKKQSSSAYLLHQCCNNYYAEKYLFTSALSCCCLAATVSPVINCNDGFNGGCEQVCNPGPPASCGCSTVGLVPSPTNRRTCVGAFTVLLHGLVVCCCYAFATVGCVAQLAERRSLVGELTLSCARPAVDG